jgi:hypothetical protein
VLTIGTLVVVFLIAVVGYMLGRNVRERVVEVALEREGTAPVVA